MKHLKSPQELNEASENLNISDVIDRFTIINRERNSLNIQIRDYYTPLLTNATKNKDKAEYDRLLSELPDCPFLLTAHRIGELNGL
jgi:hypothetical protein